MDIRELYWKSLVGKTFRSPNGKTYLILSIQGSNPPQVLCQCLNGWEKSFSLNDIKNWREVNSSKTISRIMKELSRV